MNDSSTIQGQSVGEQGDKGFTLIEILIAIVLVGILSAVAVVGISNLVSKGSSSACGATRDAATAASAVYYTSQAPNTYPTNFTRDDDASGDRSTDAPDRSRSRAPPHSRPWSARVGRSP